MDQIKLSEIDCAVREASQYIGDIALDYKQQNIEAYRAFSQLSHQILGLLQQISVLEDEEIRDLRRAMYLVCMIDASKKQDSFDPTLCYYNPIIEQYQGELIPYISRYSFLSPLTQMSYYDEWKFDELIRQYLTEKRNLVLPSKQFKVDTKIKTHADKLNIAIDNLKLIVASGLLQNTVKLLAKAWVLGEKHKIIKL